GPPLSPPPVGPQPLVEGLPGDSEVPAGHRDVAAHLLGVANDRQPVCRRSNKLLLGTGSPFPPEDAMCTPCPSVPEISSRRNSIVVCSSGALAFVRCRDWCRRSMAASP